MDQFYIFKVFKPLLKFFKKTRIYFNGYDFGAGLSQNLGQSSQACAYFYDMFTWNNTCFTNDAIQIMPVYKQILAEPLFGRQLVITKCFYRIMNV